MSNPRRASTDRTRRVSGVAATGPLTGALVEGVITALSHFAAPESIAGWPIERSTQMS
jgi:hypothetical protein